MRSMRKAVLLFMAATVTATACDEFPEDPEFVAGEIAVDIEPVNWPAVVRLEEGVTLEVEVRDGQDRVVLDPPLEWAPVDGTASLSGTDALQRTLTGNGLGWARIGLTVGGETFRSSPLQDSIPVVLAGISLATPTQDTVMTSLEDTISLSAAGLTLSGGAVAGSNLQWRVAGVGAVEALTTAGDGIKVVARTEGEDTVYVSHPFCAGECEPFILVNVAQVADTVAVTPTQDTLVAEDTVRFVAAGRDARRFEIASEVFTWVSTNETVVTVDENGVLTADTAGSAQIIATARSGKADTTDVQVLPSGVIQVQLTDAPADNLASAVLYLGGVYVMDNQATRGRRYIMEDAFEIDLLTLTDTVSVLGNKRVPVGTYGNVFLQVDSARIDLLSGLEFGDGTTSMVLTPPEGQMDSLAAAVNGSASVAAADTVKIVIDFDVDQSFPMSEPQDGVIQDVAFDPSTRTLKKQDAAEVQGTVTVAPLGTAEADSLTLRGVRTDMAGDTVYARTALDGTFKFRYLIPGDYTVTMPQAPACHLPNPASRAVSVTAGQVLAATDFSLDPVTVDSVIAAPAEDTINAIGNQAQISATAYEGTIPQPGLSFNWSTLDPAIATVDANGLVTGTGTGTVGIVAASCAKADTAYVLVRQVPAAITVTPELAEVRAGETLQLSAVLEDSAGVLIPGATFDWTSGATDRATVDAATGLVTGVRTGTVTITATHAASGVAGSVDVSVLVATVELIEVSGSMGCMLSASNEVLCWGQNYEGGLGFAATDWFLAHKPSTIPLPTTETYTDLGVGDGHACALTAAGQIYCWGRGWSGELGDGNLTSSATPVLVTQPIGETFASVTAGPNFTCATTTANSAYCWGYGSEGQLGNGVSQNQGTPVGVFQSGGVDFVAISAGSAHTCSLGSNGRAQCWGRNDHGQLGNNSYGTSYQPVAVGMPTGVTFSEIKPSDHSTCALSATGDIYCWGWNTGGRIDRHADGNGDYLVPTLIGGGEGFVSLGGGANSVVCGILPDGQAQCTGGNYFGQFGNGASWRNDVLFEEGASGLTLTAMDGGAWDTMCALTTTGDPYCWGDKWIGRLGTGERAFTLAPEPTSLTGVTSLDQHWAHSCALSANQLYCWEDIAVFTGGGQEDTNVAQPTNVTLPAGETFEEVAVGSYSACVLATDGDVYCIGNNFRGQLGDGSFNYSNGAWVKPVMPVGVTFTSITAGYIHYCAMGSDNNPYCWGYNGSGQLGNGTFDDSNTPVAVSVPSGLSFVTIDAGTEHTCATTSISTIYCWGWGDNGELGNNTFTGSSVPQEVLSAASFEQVSAGDYTTCALAFDGSAHCWGYGNGGQLGNGGNSNSGSPVAVTGGHVFDSIETGSGSTNCGTKSDGTVFCWGRNWEGVFGNGIMDDSNIPVLALGGMSTQGVAGSYGVTCAVDAGGALWCTGRHDHGQTAIGRRGYEVTPVRVGGGGTVAAAASATFFGGASAPLMAPEAKAPVRSAALERDAARLDRGATGSERQRRERR